MRIRRLRRFGLDLAGAAAAAFVTGYRKTGVPEDLDGNHAPLPRLLVNPPEMAANIRETRRGAMFADNTTGGAL
jgi:hypothetical protein